MAIKLIEIDITKPIQSVYLDEHYERMFAVIQCGYLPVGMLQLECPTSTRTYSSSQLVNIIHQTYGWTIWELALNGRYHSLNNLSMKQLPSISVVVCTRDRPISLKHCLASLSQLDYPSYDVTVVDNCSNKKAVKAVINSSGFRYIREDTPGLDWARNRGLLESKYDIVAFIDDDAIATSGWLRGVAHGFEDPNIMVVTGMILPKELETTAQIEFERYGGMSKGFVPYTVTREKLDNRELCQSSNFGVGANFAVRQQLIKQIERFDVSLDVGTPTNGGGDIEFFYRAVASGYSLQYEPAAMVYHMHRRDIASLHVQIYNNGRSFASYLITIYKGGLINRRSIMKFAVYSWVWKWIVYRMLVAILKSDKWTLKYAFLEFKGMCSAPWAYYKSKKILAEDLSSTS